MKRTRHVVAIVALMIGTLVCVLRAEVPAQTGAPPSQQQDALERLRARIAGSETKPAEEVFKNITILKGVPAGRLLAIMSVGFGRSLGVDCAHCHVADRWESDEKPAKQVARDMWMMTNAINTEYLSRIENLKGRNPIVNCTTCHRGQLKPALNLAEATRGESPHP